MKRTVLLFLALTSWTFTATGATRPRYGGTTRVEMQSAPATLELSGFSSPTEYWETARVLSMIGDNLITLDAEGRPHPALATAWQSDLGARHWQFTLRSNIKFHEGVSAAPAKTAEKVAEILSALHPDWSVRASRTAGDSAPILDIETQSSNPFLLAELALPRNLILFRNANGIPIGTGPFRIADFQAGKILKLVANDDSWSGRPFIDVIDIEFGEPVRDQAIAFELGKADVVESSSQSAASAQAHALSLPVELMALVFNANSKAQDPRLREALALAIDRKPIQSVILKGAAEPAATILPNWMTGYTAAFPIQPNPQRAKTLLAELRQPGLTLSYDARDPQAQLIAERIALNAREAGIDLQVSLSRTEDVRLVRIALPVPDPGLALRETAHSLSLSDPLLHGETVDDLYQAEQSLLADHLVIPLFHLPLASAASARVRRWAPDQLGNWNLAAVWIEDSR